VRVFFDPRMSEKGAVITAGRAPRREKDPSDYASAVGEIYNPHALPMYKVRGGGCPVTATTASLLLPHYYYYYYYYYYY
jgi:hypothetical protein